MFGLLKKWWKPSDVSWDEGPCVEDVFRCLREMDESPLVTRRQYEEVEYGGVVVQRMQNRTKETSSRPTQWSNGLAAIPYWYETIVYQHNHFTMWIQQVTHETYVTYYHTLTWEEDGEIIPVATDHLWLPTNVSFRHCKKQQIVDVLEDEREWAFRHHPVDITLEEDAQYHPFIWVNENKRLIKHVKKELEGLTHS